MEKTNTNIDVKLEGYQIIGIKRVAGKKNKNTVYTTYYCQTPWSDYEIENADELQGCSVEAVSTTYDFPIQIGDIVKFFYGKSMGDWQPVIDYKLISKASNPFNKDADLPFTETKK